MRQTAPVLLAFLAAVTTGCGSGRYSAYRPAKAVARDTEQAQHLSQRAADLIGSDLDKAEALLRDSLSNDLFYGPAHNNLGVVYLKRGELYSAANEFEWARKLMPGHPDPRINLGLTLEKAGQTEDAIAAYRSALESAPLHIDAMTGLARLQIASARADEETVALLGRIERSADNANLREWARDQRIRLVNASGQP